MQAIQCFPYSDMPTLGDVEAFRAESYPDVFHALFNAVERLTFLGGVDLQLQPTCVSLLDPLRALSLPEPIIGQVLLNQAQSVLASGRSKARLHSLAGMVLRDLLDVYALRLG